MSITDCGVAGAGNRDGSKPRVGQRPLHRVGIVRRLQGISRRTVARRLDIDVAKVKLQERATADMLLSRLYEWQDVLDVPVVELLVEAEDELATPVLKRAQLVRLTKTVLAILEHTEEEPTRRLAQTLVDQLIEIMPELNGVSPWHTVGKRRCRDEFGVAAERRLSDDVFLDLID